jgi:hypothetical protein
MDMILGNRSTETPLGVECAWPAFIDVCPSGRPLRRHRLAEAWRRLMAVLQPNKRCHWTM